MTGQNKNSYSLTFKTTATNGLLLLQHKATSVQGDYLALAVRGGHVEASFNLGTQTPTDLLYLTAGRTSVSDGTWHTVTFER